MSAYTSWPNEICLRWTPSPQARQLQFQRGSSAPRIPRWPVCVTRSRAWIRFLPFAELKTAVGTLRADPTGSPTDVLCFSSFSSHAPRSLPDSVNRFASFPPFLGSLSAQCRSQRFYLSRYAGPGPVGFRFRALGPVEMGLGQALQLSPPQASSTSPFKFSLSLPFESGAESGSSG
eukprot:3660055-Rhodomonas_salina.1